MYESATALRKTSGLRCHIADLSTAPRRHRSPPRRATCRTAMCSDSDTPLSTGDPYPSAENFTSASYTGQYDILNTCHSRQVISTLQPRISLSLIHASSDRWSPPFSREFHHLQ
ncbi:hypothetical protein J6590_004082 [Homalodisca vitripennis]|nr:hypothetical protein J6590_004082 [Homalodisca vitripennis]